MFVSPWVPGPLSLLYNSTWGVRHGEIQELQEIQECVQEIQEFIHILPFRYGYISETTSFLRSPPTV